MCCPMTASRSGWTADIGRESNPHDRAAPEGAQEPRNLLAGDDDRLVPVANGHILARLIPDARLVVARGGGHPFLLELAPATAGLVADFLAE